MRITASSPFTNGNERTARLLTNFLAFRHGYQEVALYQRSAGQERDTYLRAIKASNAFDYLQLEDLIRTQLRRFSE